MQLGSCLPSNAHEHPLYKQMQAHMPETAFPSVGAFSFEEIRQNWPRITTL